MGWVVWVWVGEGWEDVPEPMETTRTMCRGSWSVEGRKRPPWVWVGASMRSTRRYCHSAFMPLACVWFEWEGGWVGWVWIG